jgi:hypothetical protein
MLLAARLRYIIDASLAAMAPLDKAQRIAWCQATGRHGVRLVADGDSFRLVWGGRPLAVLEQDVFLGQDTYLRDLEMLGTSIPDTPGG